jgi:hypothetical protein
VTAAPRGATQALHGRVGCTPWACAQHGPRSAMGHRPSKHTPPTTSPRAGFLSWRDSAEPASGVCLLGFRRSIEIADARVHFNVQGRGLLE